MRAGNNFYFMDAITPELPSEYVNVKETSNESRNVKFIETLPVKINAFDHDHNYGSNGTFLGLESSSVSLVRRKRCRNQKQMPNRTPVTARVGAQ